MKLLPEDEYTLDGIIEFRVEFHNVSDSDATTFEQHVLGCIKGRLPAIRRYLTHTPKANHSTKLFLHGLCFLGAVEQQHGTFSNMRTEFGGRGAQCTT